jgi:FkbM family methyltransferase
LLRRADNGSREATGHIDKRLLAPLLPDDPVVIDAGAHVGSDTLDFARRWPKGTVHAFEPVPQVYAQLVAATRETRNVATYEQALGPFTGTTGIHVSGGASDGSSSMRRPTQHLAAHPTVTFDREVQIRVQTLDDWAADHSVDRVDCMWLDMQGSELDALRAGEGVLRTVRAIVTETFTQQLYEGAPLWPELRAFLEEHGFAVVHEEFPWSDGVGNVVLARHRSNKPRRNRK